MDNYFCKHPDQMSLPFNESTEKQLELPLDKYNKFHEMLEVNAKKLAEEYQRIAKTSRELELAFKELKLKADKHESSRSPNVAELSTIGDT